MNISTHKFLIELAEKFSPDDDEILINGTRGVFASSPSGHRRLPNFQASISEISDLIRDLAYERGLRLDIRNPSCGGILDAFALRWHAVVSPVSQDELVLTFRRHRFNILSLDSFQIGPPQQEALQSICSNKTPIVIAGPTGVGKSSFLLSLLKEWHSSRRVVIIEAVSELPTLFDTWIRLTEATRQVSGDGAFSLEQVARETLRLRPDTFVVGELRGSEAEVFVDLSLCGHGGCLTTIHAASIEAARLRLKRLAPQSTRALPIDWQVAFILLERQGEHVVVKDIKTADLN